MTTGKNLTTLGPVTSSSLRASMFACLAPTPRHKMVKLNALFAPSIMSFAHCSFMRPCLLPTGWRPSLQRLFCLTSCPPRLQFSMPHLALPGTPPAYDHLRIFGYNCYPNMSATAPRKLAPRSVLCVFLGYSAHHKGYVALTSPPIESPSPGTSSLMKRPSLLLRAMVLVLRRTSSFLMLLMLCLLLLDRCTMFCCRITMQHLQRH